MRYAILSDVHANLEALTAVLDAARREGVDRIVCLGDIVGYHADPDACVDLLRSHDALSVAGNHDRAAAGVEEPSRFNDAARRAILWTRSRISTASRAYLAALPICRTVECRFVLVHGALHPVPNADLHLTSDARARRSILALRKDLPGVHVAFFGHTHRSVVHEMRAGAWRTRKGVPGTDRGRGAPRSEEAPMIELCPGSHYLINPGSVGQPRDGDPRASFLVFDAESLRVRFRRVAYDPSGCIEKAARAGLLGGPERPSRGASFLGALLGRIR